MQIDGSKRLQEHERWSKCGAQGILARHLQLLGLDSWLVAFLLCFAGYQDAVRSPLGVGPRPNHIANVTSRDLQDP